MAEQAERGTTVSGRRRRAAKGRRGCPEGLQAAQVGGRCRKGLQTAQDRLVMPLAEVPQGCSSKFPTWLTLILLRLAIDCHGLCRRVAVVL